MSTETTTKRRRGATLEKVLLEAAWDELQAVGYQQLSFERVAKRAGTSKPVLYRRWPSRLDLVRATLRAHRPLFSGFAPDTGSLRGDVLALLDYMTHGMREVPDIVWGMAVDAISHNAQAFRQEITASNTARMHAILQQAADRGDIATTALPKRLVTLPIDLARHEMLITGQPPTPAAVIQIVDEIFVPLITQHQLRDI